MGKWIGEEGKENMMMMNVYMGQDTIKGVAGFWVYFGFTLWVYN